MVALRVFGVITALALFAIACEPVEAVTARQCRRLVPSTGDEVLSMLNTQVCDRRGFFRSLRQSCRQGLCDGVPRARCIRFLRQTGRSAIGPFCDPLTGFDDLPLRIRDDVQLDVGFQVPVTCWPSRVCLRITHTFVGDLTISIRSPNNERFLLVDQRGGGGNNLDACFANRFARPVRPGLLDFSAVPVIEGNFKPVDRFPTSPVPGNWIVRVNDKIGADQGTLDFADVTFSLSKL